MVKKGILTGLLFAFFLVSGVKSAIANEDDANSVTTESSFSTNSEMIYHDIKVNSEVSVPSLEVFSTAMKGFKNLVDFSKVKKNILSVIDFSLPSTVTRLWVIDLNTKEVLINDHVAHGRNSGDNVAIKFSNVPNSKTSSMGFYITAEKYIGKHGLSLRLDGMDKGYNDNARKRAIVMHGADYVSTDFIERYGRLGRSLGCPAVSMHIHEDLINTIHGGSVLFIYSEDYNFMKKSPVLNPKLPLEK